MHRIRAHCTCIARTAALIARTGTHCHAHFTMPLKKLVFHIFNYVLNILPLKLAWSLTHIQRARLEFQKKPFSKFWIFLFSGWRWSISRDDTCAYQMEWHWQTCTFIWSSLRRCFNACAYFFEKFFVQPKYQELHTRIASVHSSDSITDFITTQPWPSHIPRLSQSMKRPLTRLLTSLRCASNDLRRCDHYGALCGFGFPPEFSFVVGRFLKVYASL